MSDKIYNWNVFYGNHNLVPRPAKTSPSKGSTARLGTALMRLWERGCGNQNSGRSLGTMRTNGADSKCSHSPRKRDAANDKPEYSKIEKGGVSTTMDERNTGIRCKVRE